MRRLGVFGENLPTRKSRTVEPSDFLIGGFIAQFERKYDRAFEVSNPTMLREVFGENINPAWYGHDALKGFFDNVVGVQAKAWVKAYVGNTGSAIDAVVASRTVNDQSAAATMKAEAAYKGVLEYGISGLRTGYTITNGYRFSTKCTGSQNTANSYVILDSVIGIKVGDIIKIEHTSAIYKKVTAIDENLKRVDFATALGATVADATVVGVMGLRLRTYRRGTNGVVQEVEEALGRVFVTLEPEVTEFYISNIHAENRWIKWTDMSSVTAIPLCYPLDVSTVTYLENGADGTAASDSTWTYRNLSAFDNLPVRFIANPETTTAAVNKAGESYCKARWDNPKWIYNFPENQSKAQLITLGNSYQRSDDVYGVGAANWLGVPDPFVSGTGPDRRVPNVGHVMGAWIRCIGIYGIHYIPAIRQVPLLGVNSVIGDQLKDDQDRTDVADAGINMIQELTGYGIVIRNFFTPSTAIEFKFANGLLMRSYIKVSAVDSLQESENTPNSFARIKEDRTAIYLFMLSLWNYGSTGSVPPGETFGISEADNNATTSFEDHVEVTADAINNPQAKINLGERNIDVYFTFPTPAGSIRIGVGILLR